MTTWVLLRGLMRESRHWGKFPTMFQNALGARHVVTMDFPGNGRLHAAASANSVVGMAENIRAQLIQLEYAPPYRVLALSLGAMVTVAWSELYPAEIEKMVLINTSMAPYNPFYQRLRPANYPALIRLMLPGSADQRERLILRLTSRSKCRSEHLQEILHQWTAYARECPTTRANILRQLQAALCYREEKTAPSAPVLLLASQQDGLVNAKCSLTLAHHWRCAIRMHPTAGHDLPLDDGVWVTQQIRKWLDE
jgi:pimeloyl-ACP methyl ester carboxylesterase